MAAAAAKLRNSLLLPVALLIFLLFLIHNHGLASFPQIPSFVQVDAISDKNWTHVEVPSLSLMRVHHSGLLHHKVWILPFDEMWQLGLAEMSDPCKGFYAPIETHVTSGASVASAAMEVGARVRRHRRSAALLPLGRPFLLAHGTDREVVHAFALPVQGVFPRRARQWFPRVVKPVEVVREIARGQGQFCSKERALWVQRAVSYAMRRFKRKGFVPRSNPMDGAERDEAICCMDDVDESEDLRKCGVKCDEEGAFNIIRLFPQRR